MPLQGKLQDLNIHGERPIIDYTNTADWRGKEESTEYINQYHDLIDWAELTELVEKQTAAKLREVAKRDPLKAQEAHTRAIKFREAAYNTLVSISNTKPANLEDKKIIDSETGFMYKHIKLDLDSQRITLDDENNPEYILWLLVKDFVDLITSDEIERVKRCASDECGWLFIDSSKNRSRKWCNMRGCGNRAKARRYYSKKKS
jgi:predicted RNA-binding Zn ribbon-like protein